LLRKHAVTNYESVVENFIITTNYFLLLQKKLLLDKFWQLIFDILAHLAPIVSVAVANSEQMARVNLTIFLAVWLSDGSLVNIRTQDKTILIYFCWVMRHIAYSSSKSILRYYIFLNYLLFWRLDGRLRFFKIRRHRNCL